MSSCCCTLEFLFFPRGRVTSVALPSAKISIPLPQAKGHLALKVPSASINCCREIHQAILSPPRNVKHFGGKCCFMSLLALLLGESLSKLCFPLLCFPSPSPLSCFLLLMRSSRPGRRRKRPAEAPIFIPAGIELPVWRRRRETRGVLSLSPKQGKCHEIREHGHTGWPQ